MQYIEIRTNPDYKYEEVLTIINSNFALVSGSSSSFSGGTISGTTNFLGQILSAGTDLYSIFSTTGGSGDTTRVQPGANIYTAGTGNFPIINLYSSPSIDNLYFSGTATGGNIIAAALSGTNFFSGSTNLNDLFSTLSQVVILENQITTKSNLSGATFTGAVISPSLSATTISGGTIYSGGTDLYSIFLTANDGNDITRIQYGLNTYTGGTDNLPTVNISAATLNYLSATTISGGTILSGATNLNEIFSPKNTIGGFGITIDGASAYITSGIKGYVIMPFSGQIQSWEILSNVSGNTTIDVLKSTYFSFLTDTGTTITNGDYIELNSNYKNINTNLSAWTVDFNAGDIFTFNVLSASTINRANILIKAIKYN
jgi:hypothetical protein